MVLFHIERYFQKFGELEKTANAQNPVGINNPRRKEYLESADKSLNPTTSKIGNCN